MLAETMAFVKTFHPLETLGVVLSPATMGRKNNCLILIDVSRAFKYPTVQGNICVGTCDDAEGPDSNGTCWKLPNRIDGIRQAIGKQSS